MDELSEFLDFVRRRIAEGDEPLPAAPEDCAAVIGYLCAVLPEWQLDRQANAADGEARRADRKSAVLDGFRRARGASARSPSGPSPNGNGDAPEAT